jgi:multiple sugar transport system permease protein
MHNEVKRAAIRPDDRAFRWVQRVFMLLMALLMAGPLVMMITVSLQTMPEIYAAEFTLLPKDPQWGNYTAAMNNGNWPLYFKNSAIVSAITLVASLFINAMAGYVFARIQFRFRQALFMVVLIGMMIPPQVTLIPVFTMLRSFTLFGGRTGLVNTYWGLVLPYIAGSFGVFLCRQYYLTFPVELDDAARMDGCSRFQAFRHIYLPLSGPVFASLAVLKFAGTWNEYTWPLVVTSGERLKTVQLALTAFRNEGEIFWNQLMAATLVVEIPIYIVFLFAQKHFVKGLLMGSVKA